MVSGRILELERRLCLNVPISYYLERSSGVLICRRSKFIGRIKQFGAGLQMKVLLPEYQCQPQISTNNCSVISKACEQEWS